VTSFVVIEFRISATASQLKHNWLAPQPKSEHKIELEALQLTWTHIIYRR